MPIMTEVGACLGEVPARNAGSESAAGTAEMARTETPAHMRAAAEAADMRATPEAASVATAEAATVAAPASSAARERVSG